MSVADDLRAAKALIDTPEKWTKGLFSFEMAFALGKTPTCALGAVAIACQQPTWDEDRYWGAGLALSDSATPKNAAKFNDLPETTHADIMALFDRAIAAAEAPNA